MKKILIIVVLIVCGFCNAQIQPEYLEQKIIATKAHLGGFSRVNLIIDDANGDNEITKPLIIVEGFDPGRKIIPEEKYGITNYDDFRFTITQSNSNSLINLIENNNIKEYDIIYVDWENGVDYLERNAYALEEVIKWVNTQKAAVNSTEPNVILGQSMGGVIARWALADMEERSLIHDTRLFISHDAPQQGANVPLSLQYFYRHVKNLTLEFPILGLANLYLALSGETTINGYLSLLDQPATKQLLQNRSNLNYTLENTDHENFYNQLKTKGLSGSGGYPTLTQRNVAISNGSECGDIQDFNTWENLLSINETESISYLQNLLVPLGFWVSGYNWNPLDFIFGTVFNILSSGGRFNFNFVAKPLSNSPSQIYSGNITYTRYLFGFISITNTITNTQKNQPNSILPFDNYGGGYYSTTQFLNSLPSTINVKDKFSFISTPSALDIGSNNVILSDTDYKSEYVGGNPPIGLKASPFDNFISDWDSNPNTNKNKQHISFNTRNGDWLADELENNNPIADCSFLCSSNATIIGSRGFCNSATYSLDVTVPNYFWSVTDPFNLVSLSQNGNQVTLTENNASQFGGFVTLNCTFGDNDCGNGFISKTIYVGKPRVYTLNSDGTKNYMGGGYHFPLSNGFDQVTVYSESTATFNWTGPTNITWYAVNPRTIEFSNQIPGNYIFTAEATNDCGTSYYFISVQIGGSGPDFPESNFRLTQNPVINDVLLIEEIEIDSNDNYTDEKSSKINDENYLIIELYDIYGNNLKVKKVKNKNSNNLYEMEVNNYRKGHYIARIISNKKITNLKVIID